MSKVEPWEAVEEPFKSAFRNALTPLSGRGTKRMHPEAVDRLRNLLVGSSCTGMDNLGSYLQITLGPRVLVVGAPWRLVRDGEMLVGSGCPDPRLAELPALLHGPSIQTVEVRGPFNDLRVAFANGMVLEVFPNSTHYENWLVAGGPQEMIIAGPGALWSQF